MKILIAGASGLIGSALSQLLRSRGHDVARLVRRPARAAGEYAWDPAAGILDPQAVSGQDAVVNLSGSALRLRPWTRSFKENLASSRIASTRTLATAIAAAEQPPGVFVSQSGSAYYGNRGDELLTEESSTGDIFMADVCRKWEQAALGAPCRTIITRTGIVMTPRAGALPRLLVPLRLGVGGPLGSGKQWWPWITLEDEAAALAFLLESDLSGPVNLCAPEPATAGDLIAALAEELGKPARFRVPEQLLKAVLGDLATNMVLVSDRMLPRRLEEAGFAFGQPTVREMARWVAQQLH
ncbi:TIGR01777 family oxidoreductase [Arthrobacter sp. I2-34]|uniref:TIGR01777 family oxidoreductase n=1 Tax=Arthrobacter hankyongi TaxID=2904801 RepID=A0ABS9LC08_9MICC|nr:TIGR01777 family oxidoreductase [Arthrobacter hankyongi]MCG2624206.1 TIGR01777 family oxidoreductase [Arthrobacter hankyongi]